MSASDVLKIIEESYDPDETARQIIAEHSEVLKDVEQLKKIKDTLVKANLIKQASLNKSKLSGLLEGKGSELIYDKKDHSNDDLIKENIFQAYHLTSKILQELGFIDKVSYTFTYFDSKGQYHRAGDMDIDLSMVKVEAASSSRGYVSLRLQESIIKQQIAQKENDEKQVALNYHFQKFAQVYYDYENNNNTGWKANRGVIVEAFERHWENLNHSMDKGKDQFEKNSINNDLESEGRRWIMYKLSSGNDPYYTGPDTMYAQVKNANASLIDNVNTVLNTMNAVIILVENNINITNLAKKIKQAFYVAAPKANFPSKIWKGLQKDTQDIIAEEISNLNGYTSGNVKIKVNSKNVTFKE